MQTEQPDRATQPTQLTKAEQTQMVPQPWVKPTFEVVPLNDALSNFSSSGSTDVGNAYSS